MSDKTKELIKILEENPDRKLIFMYPDECSDHSYTLGYPTKIVVDEYWTDDERVWLREEDVDELYDDYSDKIFDDLYPNEKCASEEQEKVLEEKTNEFINSQDWKKCICVYISY